MPENDTSYAPVDPFETRVMQKGKISLKEAKEFAASLPADEIPTACGMYTCYSPQCPTMCLGCPCLVNCCGSCLWYNTFMCACPAPGPGGMWTCTDLKGINYWLVPVDRAGSLGFFSYHPFASGDTNPDAGCYCVKMF